MKSKTFIALLGIALSLNIMSQENKLQTKQDFKVEVKTLEAFTMLYYEHKGPYSEAFSKFGGLMEYINRNNIVPGNFSVGIYYDDPATVAPDKLRSEAGLSISKVVKETDEFKCKTIPGGKAVSVRYKSMEEIYPAYEAISKYIIENQLKTVPYSIEMYYGNDPTAIDAEILFLIENKD